MEAFNKCSISVPYHSIMKDGNALSSIQRYECDFNFTIQQFNKFYETYKTYFELIAQTIYLKL